jgi:hypothetical protein
MGKQVKVAPNRGKNESLGPRGVAELTERVAVQWPGK